jgi:hypothetical protein
MSLLERLKPKYLKMLKDEEVKYPYSAKYMQNKLASTNYWADLEYGTVINLFTFLQLFDYTPASLDNLFSDEEH